MMKYIEIPGPVAQDKDWARAVRTRQLLPSLRGGKAIKLDFSGVQIATQSFIHALLSEATRVYGEEGLGKIEFHSCSEQVRHAIQTVVTYSLRAREIANDIVGRSKDSIRSTDVPQADDLQKVRRVVEVVSDGPSPIDILAEELGYSVRHTYYRATAARILELLQITSGIVVISDRGINLTATQPGSTAERRVFKEAIIASMILRRIAPGLLARKEPKRADIAARLATIANLAPSTASRRAQCLLSWRRQLLERQLPLLSNSAGRKRSHE